MDTILQLDQNILLFIQEYPIIVVVSHPRGKGLYSTATIVSTQYSYCQ